MAILQPIPRVILKATQWMKSAAKKLFDQTNREYTLQVAAMTTQSQADRMMKRLGNKGLKGVYMIKNRRSNGGYWYKIRLGKFNSKQSAQEFADRLIGDRAIKNYFIISYIIDSR